MGKTTTRPEGTRGAEEEARKETEPRQPKTQNKDTLGRAPPNAGACQDAETLDNPQTNWGEKVGTPNRSHEKTRGTVTERKASLEDQRRAGGKLEEQSPPRTEQKRELEKRNRTGRPTQRKPMNRRRRRTPPKRTEDEPSRHKNLGTERNRDHVSKRKTPQWEEVTGNPSSGKDKKTRNHRRPKQD